MDAAYRMLGQRIVEAARLAVAVHLHSTLSQVGSYQRQVVIGGAGPVVLRHDDLITDEVPPAALDCHPRSAPSADEGGAA